MNLKKVILIIFLMIVGMQSLAAEGESACTANNYDALAEVYKELAVLSYYHSVSDKSMTDKEKQDILNNPVLNGIKTQGNDYYENLYNNIYLPNGVYNMGNSSLAYKMLSRIGCDKVAAIYNKTASNVNNTIDYLWGEVAFVTEFVAKLKDGSGKDHTSEFSSLENSTRISFEGLCDYLDSHKGIAGFIKTALNIVTYAALALGVILGILDFIQAIASHDDAALNKAGQKFFKRVIAIILIFLSSFIVTMIVNIVSINGVDRQNVICKEFNMGVKV